MGRVFSLPPTLKNCQFAGFHFMFASVLSINVYYACERHPECVGPFPFFQKDRVAILLGKF